MLGAVEGKQFEAFERARIILQVTCTRPFKPGSLGTREQQGPRKMMIARRGARNYRFAAFWEREIWRV